MLSQIPVNSFSPKSRPLSTSPKRSNSVFVAASYDGDQLPLLSQANILRKDTIDLAKRNDFSRGLENIRYLMSMFETADDALARIELLQIMDDAIGGFTALAFAKPYRGRNVQRRVGTGLEALQLQLSSFPSPFDEVPRHSLVEALRALSAIIAQDRDRLGLKIQSSISAETAFRILQRLLSGVGVRGAADGKTPRQALSERDFNSLLNAVVNAGRMDVAHKVVALQERTPNAPPLTPVTYSILLKGYGRLGDSENVEMILQKAEGNGIQPDTVMLNSVLDAFVNCKKIEKAEAIFRKMTETTDKSTAPNIRTYNTMLKGFAVSGALDQARDLAELMQTQHLWDAVTTNTLVSAAVNAQAFEYAEQVLSIYTESPREWRGPMGDERRDHPNVEAYTQLLDGYAKAGFLDKALSTLQQMRSIQVTPNEYTYTCMVAGLARNNRFESAVKLLDFMEASGVMPSVVTYNAFISALGQVSSGVTHDQQENDSLEFEFVEQGIELLRRMMAKGTRPNVTTISTLLECFAKCSRSRIGEATAIVQRFEREGIIPIDDVKINTAMLRVYGAAKDVMGALEVFRRIRKPDTVAVNAFLDAACRSGELKIAFETFEYLFGPQFHSRHLKPDVITFSILMSAQLRLNTVKGVRKAQDLYQDMRQRLIKPDHALVDMILSAMTKGGRIGLKTSDIQFVVQVLKDASSLEWKNGDLEQRKQTVRAIMVGRMSEVWKVKEDYYGMNVESVVEEEEDELFRRKGWNKVDSGFRLWGGGDSLRLGQDQKRPKSEQIDDFLASKGWNDVDSGFRLF